MSPQEIYDNLKAKFGDAIAEAKLDAPRRRAVGCSDFKLNFISM